MNGNSYLMCINTVTVQLKIGLLLVITLQVLREQKSVQHNLLYYNRLLYVFSRNYCIVTLAKCLVFIMYILITLNIF